MSSFNSDDFKRIRKEWFEDLDRDRSKYSAIMNNSLLDKLPKAGEQTLNFNGIPVVTSDLVPPDKVYLVPKVEMKVSMPEFRYELEEDSILRVSARLSYRIASAFGVPGYLLNDAVSFPAPYPWQRWPRESVLAWGERLSKRDLLDKPAIRWEFQKAVFKAMGSKALSLLRGLR